MVGIHARTGREKIFARNVAHVLNDETQRKYIQVCFKMVMLMSSQVRVRVRSDKLRCREHVPNVLMDTSTIGKTVHC